MKLFFNDMTVKIDNGSIFIVKSFLSKIVVGNFREGPS